MIDSKMTQNPIPRTDPDSAVRDAFRIFKENGEPIRRVLDEFNIVDYDCKPFADDVYLYLPLHRSPDKEECSAIRDRLTSGILCLPRPIDNAEYFGGYVKNLLFQTHKKAPTVSDLLGFSVAYEIIGDIAVLDDKFTDGESDSEISVFDVADAVLTAHSAVKTVLLSKGPISGEFRTRDLEFIAGADTKRTVHKEYGCKYKVDLGRAYFTPRLSAERHRIMTQIADGDTVIDMFAGVGPYSILIAKSAKPARVIANDKNDAAVELLKENIALNKVQNIIALNEDALFLSQKYAGAGDHIIMNLPHNACDFLETAVTLCKSGGVIHYYAMTSESDLFESSVERIRDAAKKQGRKIEVFEMKNVRSYAPHQYNICLDVRIV
ncbi:MAG: class I SAM-dependent methyltransferase family protein [Methanosarcinales archaeon]|jgi:tRNA (guanine37-N1)-methyltransferase|nr:class I SAM-dependent methyltransferase family protein [Methanosarcinales archaeon]